MNKEQNLNEPHNQQLNTSAMDLELKLKIEQAINDCALTVVVKDVNEKYCIPPVFFPKLRDMMIDIMCEGKETSDEGSNCNKPAVINWVAVKEKPPKNTWILVGHNKDKWVDRGELSDLGFYYNGECEIYPTHWAKMPKPPCL